MSATLTYSAAREAAVVMKHGAGGRAMRRLIQETLIPGFVDVPVNGIGLAAMDDGAALRVPTANGAESWLVVTTDSHVVHPSSSRAATSVAWPSAGR